MQYCVEICINHVSVTQTYITLGRAMCLSAAQYPLVHVDYIKQYAARPEYIRRVGTSPPMAEPCKKPLYLRAQFNTPDFGGATLGWIDRACHCFTGSHSTMELYRLPCVPLVNVTVLQNHTAWICLSSFHTCSITYQLKSTETLKCMSFSVDA